MEKSEISSVSYSELIASGQYVSILIHIAAVTVMIYDALLTLEEEIIYIWNSTWSPITGVFMIVRYLSLSIYLFSEIATRFSSDSACSIYKWFIGITALFIVAAADFFLIFRVYAFCGKNKRLLIFLILLSIGWEVTTITLGIVFLPLYVNVTSPVPQLHSFFGLACISLAGQRLTVIWIGMLSYQSILFACLLFKIILTQYEAWKLGITNPPLYVVFIRDGLWAYFLIVVSLGLGVVSVFKARSLSNSFIMWFITTTNICCCRFILNLRSTAHRPISDIHISCSRQIEQNESALIASLT